MDYQFARFGKESSKLNSQGKGERRWEGGRGRGGEEGWQEGGEEGLQEGGGWGIESWNLRIPF